MLNTKASFYKSCFFCLLIATVTMAKKAPDAQPGRSIVFLSSEHPPEVHRLTPTMPSSCLNCPDRFHSFPPTYRPPEGDSDVPLPQTDLLHRERLSPCLGMDRASPLRVWQPTASPYILCNEDIQERSPVDSERVENVYKEHASDLWSTVTAGYPSMNRLTPSQLEHALFCEIPAGDTVTACSTSNHSPSQSTASTLFQSSPPGLAESWKDRNNTAAHVERLSVESLLNHRG